MLCRPPLDDTGAIPHGYRMNEQGRTSDTLPEVLLQVALGDHDWRVRAFELHEELGQPYHLVLELISENDDIDVSVDELLGQEVVLFIRRGEDERVVPGIVRTAALLGVRSRKHHMTVTAVPALGLLEERQRSRIFQNMTVIEIVQEVVAEVFEGLGRRLDPTKLTADHPPRDHRAQYRESDLRFLLRILQEEGLTFRFDIEDEREIVVLVDDSGGFREIETLTGEPRLALASHDPEVAGEETVHHFAWSRSVRPGRVRAGQWTWKDDPRMLIADANVPRDNSVDPADRQRTFFVEQHDELMPPGRDAAEPEPDNTPEAAASTLRRFVADAECGRGQANAIGLAAGVTFELGEHPEPDLDRVYVVTKIVHTSDCPHADAHDAPEGAAADYVNHFECLPLEVPYRPRRLLPKPTVTGPHLGVVAGNQEIHTDPYGRIRVRMNWDSSVEERGDGTEPSCWLRVVSPWGGFEHGIQAVPRVGSEVVVGYLDGDIDQPVCLGCLYNGKNKVLRELPEERTKFTLRTRSSPGGDGFNELTFEDQAGAEEVFLHAQRDMNTKVRRNQTTAVDNDQSVTVGRNQKVKVKNDREVLVDRHERHAVGKDRMRRVEGTEEVIIHGSQNVHIGGGPGAGSAVEPPEAGGRMAVQGTYEVFARDKLVLQVGNSTSITITPDSIKIEAPTAIKLEVPGAEVSLEPGVTTCKAGVSEMIVGPNLLLKSDSRVRNQCGSSHVTVDPMAVRARALAAVVDGTSITTIKSGGPTTVSGQSVSMDAQMDIFISSQGQITATCSGSKQTIMGGMINLE